MPLWAEDTRIEGIRNASSSSSSRATTTKEQPPPQEDLPLPDPKAEAARMASMKKLRHRFVQLCSEHGNCKPPLLALERWLGRAALSKKQGDDPILPSCASNNAVADHGAFVKDISRKVPSREASTLIAKEMTKEVAKQIRSIAAVRDEDDEHPRDLESLRKSIRDQGRTVKEVTKAAVSALKKKQQKQEVKEEETTTGGLLSALAALQKAASELNETAAKAQRAVGSGDGGGENQKSKSGSVCGDVVFNGARREGIYDVMLCGPGGKPRRPYLTISSLHLSKLLRLWKLHGSSSPSSSNEKDNGTEDPIQTMNALPETDRVLFQKSLYCCLARYEALKGAGYQCALPGMAFDAAAACGLGNTIECFASPLNCRYERFCSAFPDIEHRFGSLGSFFDDDAFDPQEGSFEANPPFVPETMVAMGEKLERLLSDKIRGPLSFLVVVPAWGAGVQFVENLEASVHVRVSTRVGASNHAFCDGAQHTKPLMRAKKKSQRAPDPDLRPSSWDTAVILMQNEAGAAKWSVDSAKLEESFCKALKASIQKVPGKFATLEAWEHRGVGRGGKMNGSGNKRSFGNHANNRNQRHKTDAGF